jgi:hypothetical protein
LLGSEQRRRFTTPFDSDVMKQAKPKGSQLGFPFCRREFVRELVEFGEGLLAGIIRWGLPQNANLVLEKDNLLLTSRYEPCMFILNPHAHS